MFSVIAYGVVATKLAEHSSSVRVGKLHKLPLCVHVQQNSRNFLSMDRQSAGVVRPPTSSWSGHQFKDDKGSYFFKSMVCHPALAGHSDQTFSLEMLHFDDYCKENNVAGQSMQGMFQRIPFQPVQYTHHKTTGEKEVLTFHCAAISSGQHGAPVQNLSTEMIHFDDYLAELKQPANPTMQDRFRMFYGHDVATTTAAGEPLQMLIKCITASQERCGAVEQNFSVEMQHWDDYRVEQGAPVNPNELMKGLFDR